VVNEFKTLEYLIMYKHLEKLFAIVILLSASNGYALSNCSGASPYTWNNCKGSHTLMNGMDWTGEYQRGGPNGRGELSFNGGGTIEGTIVSMYGVVTGISGKMYVATPEGKALALEGDVTLDEIIGEFFIVQGKFYFDNSTVEGFMLPDDKGEDVKYVGKMTQTDNQSGYVMFTSSDINVISEAEYKSLEQQYTDEIYNYRIARGAELTSMYGSDNPNSYNYQKNHSDELAQRRAEHVYERVNGVAAKSTISTPTPDVVDSIRPNQKPIMKDKLGSLNTAGSTYNAFIKKIQAIK